MYMSSLVVALAAAARLFMVHIGLHKENDCHMTYMWRHISLVPFSVNGNTVRSYGMYRYIEGFVNEKTMSISSNDIPVLFVPGSGGSAKQVRSVASIMMNKTEMTSAPFRMHFYAVDFDEELSFLSGATVNRERDFVMKAISTVQAMYSRKIVLIGHSFGGTIIHALPACPDFDISKLGLVIALAAPLVAPPILMDETMAGFYESMNRSWTSRRDELRNVGFVSYSGGSKDFQVPDHLTAFPGSHVVHRPSWSIRGVDTAVDHLCILWCNQLTRHSTRILYKYGMEEVSKAKPRSARTIVKEFFQSERITSHLKISEKCADEEHTFDSASHCTSNITQIGIFDYPWVSRSYRGVLEESRKAFKLDFPSPYSVYSVSLKSKCEASLLFVYSNSLARSAAVRGDSRVMVVDLLYGLNSSTGYIVMEGKEGCEYDVNIRPDMFHSWYLVLTSNAQLLLHFLFSVCMALAVFEKLAGSGQSDQYFRGGFGLNGCIVVVVFLCFTYNCWLLLCIFAASIFYTLSCIYVLAKIIVFFRELIYSSVPGLSYFCGIFMNLLIFVLLPCNVYIANSALALLMILHRASGPFYIILCAYVACISTALGLAGPSRVHSEQFFNYLLDSDVFDLSSLFNLIVANVDLSNSFSTPVLLYLLSRFLTLVQPPRYLASFKDLFLVLLLIVPGVVSNYVSLSLEGSAMASQFLLTILSLF